MSDDLIAAVDLLCRELKRDPGYYLSWQANIAMAMYDACHRVGIKHDSLHHACQDGAIHFLNLLCMDRSKI